ncbi:DHH family phosphoesterase [Fontivita pretiosa]|uniref:DHH family phosphoesterase n=1 Tax=Fontivita pretiosa TaxID=2989684 RepID=UPI003D16C5E4
MPDPYRQIIDRLAASRRVLLTTHVRPDGDAIGTTAALALAMRKVGVESEVLLLSHLPTKYAFVYSENQIIYHDVEKGWPERFGFERFDVLLVADTGTWSQLPGLRQRVEPLSMPKIVIDHHLTQEDWAELKLVIPEAAAAGEIAAELIELWPIPIDQAIATALFVAIASDTGWFQFANTRPFTHRLAATLIEKGVDTDRIYQLLYQNERVERVALQTRAMQSLELLADGRLAVMRLSRQDFADTRASVPDTENLVNVPLQIRTVQVSVLVVEPPEPGPVRVSLRSKGQIDVARFAEEFGGGGHARAAGLKLHTSLQEARDRVVEALLSRMT